MAHPFPLFEQIWTPAREVLVNPEITSALEGGAAVAIGVSGGKDSAATALATIDYLEDAGHRGPRVLIHSDLGRVEWRQSLPACQRLAVRRVEAILRDRTAKAGRRIATFISSSRTAKF